MENSVTQRQPINIQLPEEVKGLMEGNLFDKDGLISDDMLSKFLAYNPEIIRIYGLALASLKKTKREMEIEVKKTEKGMERIRATIILKLDPGVYKNDSMREAKVVLDEEYQRAQENIFKIQTELIELDCEIDELEEMYWKHKGMGDSLDSMTKLRLAERKY